MDILVTGATGFIGRAVVQRLLACSECRLRAAVRRASYGRSGKIEAVRVGDVDDRTDWSDALRGIEVVVHLAGRAHVLKETSADPLREFRAINVGGSVRLAHQAAAAGVRRLVFISSIGVNGNTNIRPFTADDPPRPVDPYAVSKYEAECGLQQLAAQTGMELVIVRPPLVYGAGAPGNFGRLQRLVASGMPLPFGSIRNNRRSLVGLDNLVDLLVTCLNHPAAAGQIFLAGDGVDLSTAVLIEKMASALGQASPLVRVQEGLLRLAGRLLGKQAIIDRLCNSLTVDITKAQRLLGWIPPIGVDEGLRQAAAEFRHR